MASGGRSRRFCTGSRFALVAGVTRNPIASAVLSAALILTACGPAAQTIATFRELRGVHQSVAAAAGTSNVSVNLMNGRVLQIGIPNAPAGQVSNDRVRDVATAAYRSYASRSRLDSIVVLLIDRHTYFGFIHSVGKTEARRYRPFDLEEHPLLVEHWIRPQPKYHLYLVAVGDADPDLVAWLAEHVRQRYGVVAEELPPIPFDRATYDRARSQVVADGLVSSIRNRYPAVWRDATARVIGITSDDMFLRSHSWTYGFSWRSEDGRMAAVSYRRMDPAAFGRAPDAELLRSRLAKMVGKDVGVLCFGLPLSKDPRSVMYGRIDGIDELDAMTELVDPR